MSIPNFLYFISTKQNTFSETLGKKHQKKMNYNIRKILRQSNRIDQMLRTLSIWRICFLYLTHWCPRFAFRCFLRHNLRSLGSYRLPTHRHDSDKNFLVIPSFFLNRNFGNTFYIIYTYVSIAGQAIMG